MAGRALLSCALAAAVAGCGAGPASAPPLTAEVKQYRRDIAPRILSVAVTNPGPRAVVVHRLDLLAEGFADDPPAELEVEVPPGRRIDLRVPYGPARCDSGRRPGEPDAALLDVRDAEGQRHDVRLELPAGGGLLDRLHARECTERQLRAAVDVRLSAQWSRVGAELRGALVLERRSGRAPVTVVEPGGNVLFTVRPVTPGTPLGTLGADATRLELPLRITATRCDAHALAESKRSYVLAFHVALGGAAPQLTSTTADPGLQRRLDRLALDTCRPGG